MELELERIQLNGCRPVLDATVCHEETLEMIVPDACPDILRICDTEGTACLGGKEAQDGRVALSGTVRTAVLYQPDGAEGTRRMEVSIPFSCGADGAQLTDACRVVAVPRVQSAETRILNPRKVLVKVNLAVCVQAYAPVSDELCAQISAPESASVEQLCESCCVYQVSCVQEKPFAFSDDVTISSGKPEAEELLKSRIGLRCGESKVIGGKLIFKGEAALQLLYRTAGDMLCTADYVLPFSQIMEVSSTGEECGCQMQVALTEMECRLSGDGRSVSVALGLLAQAAVWEEHNVQLLTDAYSTSCDLAVESRSYNMDQLLDQGVRNQAVREILETGAAVKSVCDAYVCMGGVNKSREGERLTLSAQARVTVLYMTQENMLSSVTRTLQIPCQLELPEDAVCTGRCECGGEVYAAPAAGGVEVRFSAEFRYLACSERSLMGISNISLDEGSPRDMTRRPSVILRMAGGGERLWDIAKACGTTIREIQQANELGEEELPAGQLLLIPHKR